MTPSSRSDVRQSRLLFGYLPPLLVAAAVIVMVFVAPSDNDDDGAAGASPSLAPTAVPARPSSTAVAGGDTSSAGIGAPGTSPVGTSAIDVAPPTTTADPNVGTTASGWGTSVTPCDDHQAQVFSGYSPPCFALSGDNGGTTSRLVTEDTITVSYRYLTDATAHEHEHEHGHGDVTTSDDATVAETH